MRISEELRERTKRYASAVIRFYSDAPVKRREVDVLAHQLLRAGTSVAAHVREGSRARSDAEFCSKLDTALQEADEAQLWIELLRDDCRITGVTIDSLLRETNELISIIVTIVERTKRRAA
jgi:four helix bundle protein